MVKHRKMPFNEFSRIHYRGKTLENACFRLDNSCEHFVHRAKNGGEQKKTWHFPCVIRTANSGKHYVFPYLQTLTFSRKCVFSAVNSGEYVVVHAENANEQKENTLFAVR